MNRSQIIDTARDAITRDRAATHGEAENSFLKIAGHWNWWLADRLTAPITVFDVAQMMVGFKQARAHGNPAHADNHVDLVGYAAIAGEIADRPQEAPGRTDGFQPISKAADRLSEGVRSVMVREYREEAERLRAENDRLSQHNVDLSKQVVSLLAAAKPTPKEAALILLDAIRNHKLIAGFPVGRGSKFEQMLRDLCFLEDEPK